MKKIFFINLITIISIILILELIIRFFNYSNLMGADSKLFNWQNGHHYLTPNSSGLVFNTKVYIDKSGYRVPYNSFAYAGDKNVFFVGDSTTFGMGVPEEEIFVGRLRKKFNKINFLNTAVPGYQIKNYEKNLSSLKKIKDVDKIIYFITLNDVFSSSNIKNFANEKKFEIERNNNFWLKLKNFQIIRYLNNSLRNKSYLYMFLKGKFTDPSKRYFQNVNKFYKENEIKVLLDFVKKLNMISKDNLYVITLPYEYQTRKCNADDLIPQKKIKDLFKNIKINYYDFTEYFCKSDVPEKNFYKFDPMHLSSEGHRLVSDLLKKKINF